MNEAPNNSAIATYQIGDYLIGRTIGFGTFGKVKSKQTLKSFFSIFISIFSLVQPRFSKDAQKRS